MHLSVRKKEAIQVAVYTYGGLLLGFVFSSLFIRFDGGEMFGIYSHALAVLGFIVVIFGFGFQVGLVKINISGDEYKTVATGSMLLWTLAVLVGLGFYYAAYYDFSFNMTFLLVPVAAAATLTELVGSIWQWQNKIVSFKGWTVVRAMLNIVLIILLLNHNITTNIFLIFLCVISILNLLYLELKSGAIVWFGRKVWDRNLIYKLKTKLWGESKFFWASLIAVMVYGKISVLMLKFFDYSHQDIGRFAYLYAIMAAILVLPSAIQTYLMRPLFAREMDGVSVFRKILPIYLIIGAVCSLLFWKILPFIVELLIGQSDDLLDVFWAFAPAILVVYVANLLGMALMTGGGEKERAVVQWAAAVVHIILNFIFIPRYGLKGAALATTGSYLVLLCGFIFLVLQKNLWQTRKYAVTLLITIVCSIGFFLYDYLIIIPIGVGLILLGRNWFRRPGQAAAGEFPVAPVKISNLTE